MNVAVNSVKTMYTTVHQEFFKATVCYEICKAQAVNPAASESDAGYESNGSRPQGWSDFKIFIKY